jgi:hypothetical protein
MLENTGKSESWGAIMKGANWIKCNKSNFNSLKVAAAASACGVSKFEWIGHLLFCFSIADEHCDESGFLAFADEQRLDELVQLKGFTASLIQIGWGELKNGGIQFNDFQKHNEPVKARSARVKNAGAVGGSASAASSKAQSKNSIESACEELKSILKEHEVALEESTIREYLASRQKNKAPYLPSQGTWARNLAQRLAAMQQCGMNPQERMEEVVNNGWRTVFPDKSNRYAAHFQNAQAKTVPANFIGLRPVRNDAVKSSGVIPIRKPDPAPTQLNDEVLSAASKLFSN